MSQQKQYEKNGKQLPQSGNEQLCIADMLESIALNLESVSSTQNNYFDKSASGRKDSSEVGVAALVFRDAAVNLKNNTRKLID